MARPEQSFTSRSALGSRTTPSTTAKDATPRDRTGVIRAGRLGLNGLASDADASAVSNAAFWWVTGSCGAIWLLSLTRDLRPGVQCVVPERLLDPCVVRSRWLHFAVGPVDFDEAEHEAE